MMKIAFVVLLGLAFAGPAFMAADQTPLASDEYIREINAKSTWTASNEWTKNMTVADAKALMGTFIEDTPGLPVEHFGALLDYVTLPESFDSSKEWPACEHKILNQGQCGSCWAFGSSEALSTRFCVATYKSSKSFITLSPQYLVSCDYGNMGCNGGWLSAAWSFLQETGLPTLTCVPYNSGTTKQNGNCPSKCADGSEMKFYKAARIFALDSPDKIRAAIMTGGPVESAFTVYKNFMSYKSGVYMQDGCYDVLGGHAIKIIGWGVDNGQDYFIVDNSWGPAWGMQGRFWIGTNQCGIGTGGYAGEPDLSTL